MTDMIITTLRQPEANDSKNKWMSSVEFQGASASSSDAFGISDLASAGSHLSKRHSRPHRRTIRRLNGFLIEFLGEEARVGFIVDGQVTEYFLPARYLKESKITERGQPFEMDEYEEKHSAGFSAGTEFKPMAPSGSGMITNHVLSPEQLELRNAILAYKPFERQV
jgi:hypothetical protein